MFRGRSRVCFAAVAAGLLSAAVAPPVPSFAQTLLRDGALKIGKHALRCGRVPARLDEDLPIEGAALIGDAVVLNPALLADHPETVRLFIYHHECGHHVVGGSELAADCYAVGQGVRGGWLDRKGLDGVCRSLGDDPPSSTHPSGRARCKNMDKCFANASAPPPARPGPPEAKTAAKSAAPAPDARAFRLVRGPSLVATGVQPCATVRAADVNGAADPIGELVERLESECETKKAPEGMGSGALPPGRRDGAPLPAASQ